MKNVELLEKLCLAIGVSGDENILCVLALTEKIVFCPFGGGEVVSRYDTYRLSVKFLGIGAVNIICAKSRLNVSNVYPFIKRA